MSPLSVCRTGLLALLVVSASCADTKLLNPPTAPAQPSQPAVPTPPTPAPTPGTPSRAFTFDPSTPSTFPVAAYTLASRYVLYDDGTFTLVFPTVPIGELRGRYREASGHITFDFDWNAQIAGATGLLAGNSMTVTYNQMMSLSDFENGVYVRVPE